MRAFGILVVLLLVGAGLFFYWWSDTPVVSDSTNIALEKSAEIKSIVKPLDEESAGDNSKSNTSSDIEKPPVTETEKAPESVASLSKTPFSKPVIIEKKTPPAPLTNNITSMANPSFDVVRVDANCGILVAGRAEPTANVRVYARDKLIGSVQASSRGEWVYISSEPLSPGAQKINVKATNPNGQEVETPRLVVMQVPDCSIKEEKRLPIIAMLAPKDEKMGDFEKRVSKLLQMPEPQGDLKAAKNLVVASIDYDDKGNVALSGKGMPGNEVQVYVDNKSIGNAKIDNEGNWTLVPEKEIPAGTYNLRTDQLDKSGKVISRVEIPFQRTSAADVVLAKGSLEIRAIVQPGNSLWRIARRMYGKGTHYTTIYQANQEQIKDPDLIFPGQIFKLPSEKVPN